MMRAKTPVEPALPVLIVKQHVIPSWLSAVVGFYSGLAMVSLGGLMSCLSLFRLASFLVAHSPATVPDVNTRRWGSNTCKIDQVGFAG
jgi:hypothetical protein